ncbi:radical SAM protein [candidate division KSB1 bacterium]
MTIPYQPGIIYGPVNSRRLGSSLGLNILPSEGKYCSFNCIYCQYGWTGNVSSFSELKKNLPDLEKIRTALEDHLKKYSQIGINLDFITFSGNGEPTLHPEFEEIVDVVLNLKEKYYPDAKTSVLSNSSNIFNEKVIEALNKLDIRIMKLDAGIEGVFQKINKPVFNLSLKDIVTGLKKLKPVYIQTLFLKDVNDSEENLKDWIDYLIDINPVKIQIYSLDRPPADDSLRKLESDELRKIAAKVREQTGLQIETF